MASKAVRTEFALILSVCFIDGADQGLLGATFKSLEESLGLTPITLGLMGLAQALTMNIAGPMWGWMCDTSFASRRQLMAMGAAGWGTMMIFAGLASRPSMLIAARFFNGIFLASLMPLTQSWVTVHVSQETRGATFGHLAAAQTAGAILATALATSQTAAKWQLGSVSVEGWRYVSFLVGALSITLSCLVRIWMEEPEPPQKSTASSSRDERGSATITATIKVATREIMNNLSGHWKIPTFRVIIAQGVLGTIPWNAMQFEAMFLMYVGLAPHQLFVLYLASAPASVLGPIIGGYVGDWAALRSRYHGRIWVAMASVLAGMPCTYMMLKGLPDTVGPGIFWYVVVKSLFSATATWCLTGANRPLLNDVVEPSCRASIFAWDQALEGTVGAIMGMPLLGLVAQSVFGYMPTRSSVADMPAATRSQNMHALQSSLLVFYLLPWTLCFILYGTMHRTYKADTTKPGCDLSERSL